MGNKKLNPIMTHYIDHSYMNPLEKTSVPERPKYFEMKHYISMMKSRKKKWFSNIYIYISPHMRRQVDILVKPLSKMKEFAYSS
jgi:hypothetical protein